MDISIKNAVLDETMTTGKVQLSETLTIGGRELVLMAGPCAVESFDQTRAIAEVVAEAGARVLRGGAFKPRTSPYAFQGIGEEGLEILRAVADEFGLLVITEALGVEQLDVVARYSDIIQIGSRNMQHFPLLWRVGELDKPVLLKRGFMATVEEWLMAAEHIRSRGNERIVLCERGIRSFDSSTRNVLDVVAIAQVKQDGRYPVVGDPSHATGRPELVGPAARGAIAAGADGLIVEVHLNPEDALSDGEQALLPAQFQQMVHEIRAIGDALGRPLP